MASPVIADRFNSISMLPLVFLVLVVLLILPAMIPVRSGQTATQTTPYTEARWMNKLREDGWHERRRPIVRGYGS